MPTGQFALATLAPVLEINPLDLADQTDLHDYADVRIAAQAVDRPDVPATSRERVIESLREANPDFSEVVRVIARRDGEGVGITTVGLLGGVNAGLAIGPITVHPRYRRQGIGTALLEALLPELRARGRDTLESWGVTKGSAGERWAIARGFRLAAARRMQLLTVADVDPVSWDLAAPSGYRAERWIGETPEHLLVSVAATRQWIHDAPAMETVFHTPEWTPEMVRAEEAEARAAGIEHRVVVAVEEATGLVVALTNVLLHPNDSTHTHWRDTVVAPAHRGHGLSRFIKADLLRWLRADRPALERVETGTDAANSPMIRVNEQLGFVTAREVVVVSRPV